MIFNYKYPSLIHLPKLQEDKAPESSENDIQGAGDLTSTIPEELFTNHIGPVLKGKDLKRCERVCKNWQTIIKKFISDAQWRRKIKEEFPAFENAQFGLLGWEKAYRRIARGDFDNNTFAQRHPKKTVVRRYSEAQTFFGKIGNMFAELSGHDNQKVLQNISRVSLHGKKIAVVQDPSPDHSILILNWSKQEVETCLLGHEDKITCLSLQNHFLISGSHDFTVRVWDLNKKSEPKDKILTTHTGIVNSLSVYDNLVASGGEDTQVWIKNYQTGEKWSLEQPYIVISVSLNKEYCAVGNTNGEIAIWDWREKALLQQFNTDSFYTMRLSIQEEMIGMSYADKTVRIGNWKSNIQTSLFQFQDFINHVFLQNDWVLVQSEHIFCAIHWPTKQKYVEYQANLGFSFEDCSVFGNNIAIATKTSITVFEFDPNA